MLLRKTRFIWKSVWIVDLFVPKSVIILADSLGKVYFCAR